MFQNTRKVMNGDLSAEAIAGNCDELYAVMHKMMHNLEAGEGPLDRQVILDAYGEDDIVGLKQLWLDYPDAQKTHDELAYQLMLVHPEAMASGIKQLFQLLRQPWTNIGRRSGFDKVTSEEELKALQMKLAELFKEVGEEIGVPGYNQNVLARMATEHPEAFERFLKKMLESLDIDLDAAEFDKVRQGAAQPVEAINNAQVEIFRKEQELQEKQAELDTLTAVLTTR
jgi:hypothetical protein